MALTLPVWAAQTGTRLAGWQAAASNEAFYDPWTPRAWLNTRPAYRNGGRFSDPYDYRDSPRGYSHATEGYSDELRSLRRRLGIDGGGERFAPGPRDDAYVIQPSPIRRMIVSLRGYAAGTIVISTKEKRLYYVLSDGISALKYGIGVGKQGFSWTGIETVSRKREWPDWTPPKEMIARRPELPDHMEGGLNNPLGARALYLGSTLYRIHGTNEPQTIGKAVSSGCIRMANPDVIDLYDRVALGTKVVVF
ncbi:L,D-transpeptidase [Labrys sp. 22185]|uniref:L,D-transpeptidase n=1 Tax=Labrys sp. 22185 TaxID=3453888 RepID=UPI003F8794AE